MRWCTYKGLLKTKWTIHHVWSSTCTGWSLVHIPFSFAGELCLNKGLIRSLPCSKHSLISPWNFNGSNFFTNWTQTIFRVTPSAHSCAVACTPTTENYSSFPNLIMIYCMSMPGYVPRAPPSPILPSSIRKILDTLQPESDASPCGLFLRRPEKNQGAPNHCLFASPFSHRTSGSPSDVVCPQHITG